MLLETYKATLAHGAAVNLTSRAKLRLTGSDRVRYLNGQVTNDVRRAHTDETLYACVTDVKGRIAADVFIHATDAALLIDAEEALREPLGMRLERYIVADDAELTDVTEEWQLWHLWGPAPSTPAPLVRSKRYGIPGFDLWLPSSAAPPTWGERPFLTESDVETWRILQKVPRWPHELNAETFPPEAGLMDRAMDFAKGCYIGQEILSRIKTTGKMPRELFAFECSAPVQVGEDIVSDKAVGTVTSSALHPENGRTVGLGMLKHGTAKENLQTLSGQRLTPR